MTFGIMEVNGHSYRKTFDVRLCKNFTMLIMLTSTLLENRPGQHRPGQQRISIQLEDMTS